LPERPHTTYMLRGLGLAVRERREQRRLSQASLASALGVASQRIGALERGQLNLRYELLVALADALGVQVGELVSRAEALAREGVEPGERPQAG
jgi:transcriptional regulator with XRE-family HTH domain